MNRALAYLENDLSSLQLFSGISFMDNSWDYNGGASEIRMGKALRDGYEH